ncbi:MAG: type II toxin-antitoxin system RelE/ParE family toxin [Gammaproteobacteria bacterium]|nr:type II toxin-antitoxin system RelE/ParE family toxin [Gammaproteobacteria bacterium]
MKLRWTRPALADLVETQAFIAQDDPQAARKVAQNIWDAATNLRDNPDIGRPGHVTGTREWVVTRAPYLIVYRTKHDAVEILRVWHTRRDWRNEPAE